MIFSVRPSNSLIGKATVTARVIFCPTQSWYFETAATTPENRTKVLELIRYAPPEARNLFRLTEEDGKIVWWWQRLVLGARKSNIAK